MKARAAGGSAGALPPALFLGAIAVQLLVRLATPFALLPGAPWRAIGVLLLGAGLAATVTADRQFKRAGTAIHPFGRPSVLVTGGAFRFSRNPMYAGLVAALVGVALILRSLAALAVPPIFMLIVGARFIRHEERALRNAFGDEYADYARRVRRWI